MGEFAGTVAELGTSDVGKQLSHSLTALADVERKTQDLQAIQAQQDVITIMSTVDEYARLINSVRVSTPSYPCARKSPNVHLLTAGILVAYPNIPYMAERRRRRSACQAST